MDGVDHPGSKACEWFEADADIHPATAGRGGSGTLFTTGFTRGY